MLWRKRDSQLLRSSQMRCVPAQGTFVQRNKRPPNDWLAQQRRSMSGCGGCFGLSACRSNVYRGRDAPLKDVVDPVARVADRLVLCQGRRVIIQLLRSRCSRQLICRSIGLPLWHTQHAKGIQRGPNVPLSQRAVYNSGQVQSRSDPSLSGASGGPKLGIGRKQTVKDMERRGVLGRIELKGNDCVRFRVW